MDALGKDCQSSIRNLISIVYEHVEYERVYHPITVKPVYSGPIGTRKVGCLEKWLGVCRCKGLLEDSNVIYICRMIRVCAMMPLCVCVCVCVCARA